MQHLSIPDWQQSQKLSYITTRKALPPTDNYVQASLCFCGSFLLPQIMW